MRITPNRRFLPPPPTQERRNFGCPRCLSPRGQLFSPHYHPPPPPPKAHLPPAIAASTRPLRSIDSAFDSGDTTPAASYSNERNSSSLSRASLMIFFISQRGSSAECIGTTVVRPVAEL